MSNKMALDALTDALVTAMEEAIASIDAGMHLGASVTLGEALWKNRAAIAALQAEPQPDEAGLRQLMGMNEAEIDAELLAAGISPDDAVKRADRAIKGALATIRAERRAIMYGDIVHNHVCAMRAAVVASHLESPEAGMRWIVNTLFGPGHLPDVDEAIELGGAQAMFDKEMAEHEAFRAAHPAPVAAQPSQAPVVQAMKATSEPLQRYTLRRPKDAADYMAKDSDGQWVKYDDLKADRASSGATPADVRMLTEAARDVFAERQRQISAESWTPEHDDEHDSHEMAHAAACYAYPELTALVGVKTWPWAAEWFKVRDHRSNYVRAAALLLAEIERLDRAGKRIPADGVIGGV